MTKPPASWSSSSSTISPSSRTMSTHRCARRPWPPPDAKAIREERGPEERSSGLFRFLSAGRDAILHQIIGGICPMFDDLLRNLGGLEAVAAKIGLQPEQMQALMSEIGGKSEAGETDENGREAWRERGCQ